MPKYTLTIQTDDICDILNTVGIKPSTKITPTSVNILGALEVKEDSPKEEVTDAPAENTPTVEKKAKSEKKTASKKVASKEETEEPAPDNKADVSGRTVSDVQDLIKKIIQETSTKHVATITDILAGYEVKRAADLTDENATPAYNEIYALINN